MEALRSRQENYELLIRMGLDLQCSIIKSNTFSFRSTLPWVLRPPPATPFVPPLALISP